MDISTNKHVMKMIEEIERCRHKTAIDFVSFNGIKYVITFERREWSDTAEPCIRYAVQIETHSMKDHTDYDKLFFKIGATGAPAIEIFQLLHDMIDKDVGFHYSKITDTIYKTKEEMIEAEKPALDRDFYYKKETEKCCICYDNVGTSLRCKHPICRQCFFKVKKEKCNCSVSCPICREKIFDMEEHDHDSGDDNETA
jgi:hypothetical protein